MRFQPSLRGTLTLVRTNAFFLGGGKALVNAYYLTRRDLGVDVCLRHARCEHQLADGDAARRSSATRASPRRIRARAFVAASGGFQANLDWLRQYWGDAADNFLIRGTPYDQGRVLRDLLDQGAEAVGDPTQFHAVAIDARAPKFDGGIVHAAGLRALRHRRQPRRASASTTRARTSGRSATRSGGG